MNRVSEIRPSGVIIQENTEEKIHSGNVTFKQEPTTFSWDIFTGKQWQKPI